MYGDFLQRKRKENKPTIKKSLKEKLKVAMKNRANNVTMYEANKTTLVHFL